MRLTALLVGLGRMGAEPSSRILEIPEGWLPLSHAEAMQSTPGIDLVALCDVDPGRTERFATHYRVNRTFADYTTAITAVKPDIVSIATRTAERKKIIEIAVDNGVKGIFAEKPLARSVGDCRAILALLEKHDAKIVYGAARRAMATYRRAKEIAWSGEYGKVQTITIEFGRSPLLWSHPHSADLILYYSGGSPLAEVSGSCYIDPGARSGDTVDFDPIIETAFFNFENGISATITQTRGMNVRIGCEKGIITIHGDGEYIEVNKSGATPAYFVEREDIRVEAVKSGAQALFADLYASIVEKRPVRSITPGEILTGTQMLVGVVGSSLLGSVKLSLARIPDNLIITGRSGNLYA